MRAAIVLVPILASLAGCAAGSGGAVNQVEIRSQPSGALARTSSGHQCTTPCAIAVNRTTEFFVTFTLPGYREVTIPVRTQIAIAGATGGIGNVLFGGFVGFGVEAGTGAGLEHAPNPVHAILQRTGRETGGGAGR